MRPITKGTSPKTYTAYADAKGDLTRTIGNYCSYCERHIPAGLAVEHIQPKGRPEYAHLINEWDNFLLGCVNCNSAKKDKQVPLDHYLLPDRDNTFVGFEYFEDGRVEADRNLTADIKKKAEDTRDLCALNKGFHDNWDDEARQAALERWSQRNLAWEEAKQSLVNYIAEPGPRHANSIAIGATGRGFFSIWMKVFESYPEVRREIIAAFKGTSIACFDAATVPVSPRPNDHNLPNGGKV